MLQSVSEVSQTPQQSPATEVFPFSWNMLPSSMPNAAPVAFNTFIADQNNNSNNNSVSNSNNVNDNNNNSQPNYNILTTNPSPNPSPNPIMNMNLNHMNANAMNNPMNPHIPMPMPPIPSTINAMNHPINIQDVINTVNKSQQIMNNAHMQHHYHNQGHATTNQSNNAMAPISLPPFSELASVSVPNGFLSNMNNSNKELMEAVEAMTMQPIQQQPIQPMHSMPQMSMHQIPMPMPPIIPPPPLPPPPPPNQSHISVHMHSNQSELLTKSNLINAIELEKKNHDLQQLQLRQLHDYYGKKIAKMKAESEAHKQKLHLIKNSTSQHELEAILHRKQSLHQDYLKKQTRRQQNEEQLDQTNKENQKLRIIIHHLKIQLNKLVEQYHTLCQSDGGGVPDKGTPHLDSSICNSSSNVEMQIANMVAGDPWFQNIIDANRSFERQIRILRHLIEESTNRVRFRQMIFTKSVGGNGGGGHQDTDQKDSELDDFDVNKHKKNKMQMKIVDEDNDDGTTKMQKGQKQIKNDGTSKSKRRRTRIRTRKNTPQ